MCGGDLSSSEPTSVQACNCQNSGINGLESDINLALKIMKMSALMCFKIGDQDR